MDVNVNHCYQIASFVGTHCRGNAHLVLLDVFGAASHRVLRDRSLNKMTEKVLGLSRAIDVIVVFVASEPPLCARFFHHGREVLRCGSGTLAAAHALSLVKTHSFPGHILTSATPVTVGKKHGLFYFDMPVFGIRTTADNAPWQSCIDRPLLSVALVGGESDYCILELRDQRAVKSCRINVAQLKRISRRALIVTAKSHVPGKDYVMRYFAPQYGQYEDKATGSANAMLAGYWQKKCRRVSVSGVQLSAAGGCFRVCRIGLRQRVFGQTQSSSLSPQSYRLLQTHLAVH